MRNIYQIVSIWALTAMCLLQSCDKGFEELNTDPKNPTTTSPEFLFTNLIRGIGYSGGTNLYLYNPQTLPITRLGVYGGNDIENPPNSSGIDGSWSEFFGKLKNISELENLIKEIDPEAIAPERQVNRLAMIKIFKAYFAFVATDKFGDIPYSEAGLGLEDLLFRPKYDAQEQIYLTVLEELKRAVESMVLAENTPAGENYLDFDANQELFEGESSVAHFTKWKKFGNSLLLKHALRFSKKDVAKAKEYIAVALKGPLMDSEDDSAMIIPGRLGPKTDGGTRRNAWAWARYYGPTYLPGQFLASKMVNATDISLVDSTEVVDPRFFAIYYPNAEGEYRILPHSPDAIAAIGPETAQSSLYLQGESGEIITSLGHPDYNASHAIWNRMYAMSIFMPQQMLTYSEHCLIIAEIYASELASGDPRPFYEAGVRSSIREFLNPGYTQYPDNNPDWLISWDDTDIDDLLNDPLARYGAGNALESIRTQRWIDYFYRPNEAWALVRRTNLFDLDNTVPLQAEGTAIPMIYRLRYPDNEADYNITHYLDQLAKMGGTDNIRWKSAIYE